MDMETERNGQGQNSQRMGGDDRVYNEHNILESEDKM